MKATLMFVLVSLTWFIPVVKAVGFINYFTLSIAHAQGALFGHSIVDHAWEMLKGFLLCFGISGGFLIYYLIKRQQLKKLLVKHKRILIFYSAWIVPGFLFNLLMRSDAVGYQFSYLTALHLLILVLWILPFITWQIDRRLTGIENTYFSVGHQNEFGINKSINAFTGTFKELINVKTWGLLWITYFYTLFTFGIRKQRDLAVLHFVVLSQLSLYLIIYNVTSGNNPESSIQRLLMHIAPLAFYSIAIVFKILFGNKKFIF